MTKSSFLHFFKQNYHKPDQAKAEKSKLKKEMEKKRKLTKEKQFNKLEEDRARLDIDLSLSRKGTLP